VICFSEKKFSRNSFLVAIALGFLATACSGDDERYEVITKLRGIGVVADPYVTGPSPQGVKEVAKLKFLALVPPEHQVTSEALADLPSAYSQRAEVTPVIDSEAYEDHEKFRIFSVDATMPVPAEDEVLIPSDRGFQTFRYGMTLADPTAGEEEKMVGNLIVFSKDKEELEWKDEPPTVSISSLTQNQSVSGEIELKGAVQNSHGEKFKIGWFVSSGEVKNKRAAETTWSKVASGPQTVVMTARGTRTAAFAWAALDVVVE
jgi:hypothetical protein